MLNNLFNKDLIKILLCIIKTNSAIISHFHTFYSSFTFIYSDCFVELCIFHLSFILYKLWCDKI